MNIGTRWVQILQVRICLYARRYVAFVFPMPYPGQSNLSERRR